MNRGEAGWNTPPNWITGLRLALTPYIGWALARGDYRGALPAIVLAGASDAVDGWLARRYGWRSGLGEKLDPLADKLMVAVAYVGLTAAGALPVWLTALVLGRDAGILAAAGVLYARGRRRRFPPSGWGKLSTICQMTLGAAAVLAGAWPEAGAGRLLPPLIWSAAALTVISGADYARRAWQAD